MEKTDNNARHVPWWMLAIIIVCALPGASFPFLGGLLTSGNTTVEGLTWFYPIYTVASALLAWQCYGRRTLLCWIILILLLISHLCFFYLASTIDGLANYR
ncbi:MAG: hypothetical protein K2L39_03575 [Muribaculaceae bacterium]|nr:hypothetical protein [Muribaculaceae bacterium]MDE6360290.1 hypothetical protein [Muribaculaceae bacterium]